MQRAIMRKSRSFGMARVLRDFCGCAERDTPTPRDRWVTTTFVLARTRLSAGRIAISAWSRDPAFRFDAQPDMALHRAKASPPAEPSRVVPVGRSTFQF